MNKAQVKFKVTRPEVEPLYKSKMASGRDLKADIYQTTSLRPGATKAVPTGVFLELPEGYEAQIRSRSGLSLKKGLIVLNAPGTIDADYRGQIIAIMHNASQQTQKIEPLDRICQMVVSQVSHTELELVETLSQTERGENGFGSTGVSEHNKVDSGLAATELTEADALEAEEQEALDAADVTGDGKVDEEDLSVVHKAYAKEKKTASRKKSKE
jgi:dUTP pyrophosphatase